MDPNNPTTVGLIDGNQQKKGMAQTSSVALIWIVLTVVFLAVSIGLSGYIIYIKVFESQPTTPGSKEYIRVTYPNYFKTPAEQKIFDERYYRENNDITAKPAEVDYNRTQLNTCFFTCSGFPEATPRKRRGRAAVRSPLMEWLTLHKTVHLLTKRDVDTPLSNPVYHGCCISRLYFTSPDTAIDALGHCVTMTTIDNRRQYFPTQDYKHAVGCTGCGCAQATGYYPAVVVKPLFPDSSSTQDVLVVIKIPGCCKCFNNRNPPV